MDRAQGLLATTLCVALLALGCSRSTTPTHAVGPEQVVAEFLEAVRTGNDSKASQLLTPLARQKTAEMEMVVAPPGSETAKFQVYAMELVDDRVRVPSDWTDLDTDGRPHTDLIVWNLRSESEGWRIAGMTTQVFADQDPIVLDFENPTDMLRKQQQAEEELARRDRKLAPQTLDAQNPTTGTVR